MKVEKSCGAVVYTRDNGRIKYVIIESKEGFYGFPKGHMEKGETEKETALREIKEETGLEVILTDGFTATDEYVINRKNQPPILKQVVFFLAEYQNQKLIPQESEISTIKLTDYNHALNSLQFESWKRILYKAHSFIQKYVCTEDLK